MKVQQLDTDISIRKVELLIWTRIANIVRFGCRMTRLHWGSCHCPGWSGIECDCSCWLQPRPARDGPSDGGNEPDSVALKILFVNFISNYIYDNIFKRRIRWYFTCKMISIENFQMFFFLVHKFQFNSASFFLILALISPILWSAVSMHREFCRIRKSQIVVSPFLK